MSSITLSELFVNLVEPSAAQSKVIIAMLEDVGISQVQRFASGSEALAAMEKQVPDLVISAMHLPDITGTELVQHMRADGKLRDVAFMLVSSETNIRYLEPIRQAGTVAILPKPLAMADLKRALASTLELLNPRELDAEDLESLRVLVVDDSPTARRYIRRVLENLGLTHLTEARNGREAAELIEERVFDLVVTDYNMPEMDGKALVEFIRTRSHQTSVPVLMVTSESNEGRLAAVQQAGVSAMCDKPFDPGTVKQLLDRMLTQEQW